MPLKEYKPGTAFTGVIGRTFDVSRPAWPQAAARQGGAPNVLFIVQDDTGFGQMGCYGSPIETPNIDQLAASGLLFNNMHTTALCSPTRSCILTGRNHHSNAMSCITEGSTGYPGGNGNIPFENGMLSEMLLQHGYNTYAIGKWHLTPADQISAAGPYDRWPLGRGFERFYGFLGGDTHQYYPELVYDNHSVEPEKTPEEGYHLTEDLVDKAISFIADSKQVAPNKPFFMYFCPGAMHAPHHVPKEWADKYKGKFDDGWDAYREKTFARQKELGIIPQDAELSRHDPDVQDWDTLSAGEKKLYARMMEVFAGFLTHTDYHYGRLFNFLKTIGEWDNTLIMFISDNGASSEGGPTGSVNENKFFNNVPDSLEENLRMIDELGGPKTFNHYAWGWTFAGNTPFRRWKRETYRGGISDPFIVHWPQGHPGEGRSAHAVCPRHRHGAHRAGSAGRRAADQHQGRDAVADRRPQLRPCSERRQGAHEAHHPVLRDDGAPLHLSRRLARGLPVAGAVLHGGGPVLRRADRQGQADRTGCQGLGAVSHRRRTSPRTTTSPLRIVPS